MMKKYFNFALLSAIALTGTIGFTACSSSDEATVDVNPNYNPKTNEVTTDFVFNVSTSNMPTTRMTSANSQALLSETFRGIGNTNLFAFKGTPGANIVTATTADKTYSLGTVLTAGQINQSNPSSETSHRVLELSLPTQTTTLMFWGKALKTGTDKAQGKISFTASDANISNHVFSLQPIITTADQTKFNQFEALFVAALNKIVQTTYHADANAVSFTDENNITTKNTEAINLKWSDFVTLSGTNLIPKTTSPVDNTSSMSPLGEILADAFVSFNTVASGEIRAGSGPAILRMFNDLYHVIQKVATATPTSYKEQVSKNVGAAILANISLFCDGLTFVTTSTFETNSGLAGAAYSEVGSSDLIDFPREIFGTPEGGTQLQVAISSTAPVATWSYVPNVPTSDFGGGPSGTTSVFNYMFPAELCYFGNSPIRTSTDSHTAAQYPEGVTNWDDDNSWAAGQTGSGSVAWDDNAEVLSTTRSVAMKQNINYGTALLKTTVHYGTGTLKDNNHAIQKAKNSSLADDKEPDAEIDVTKPGQFTLTGVLVGGQTQDMGWNYVAKGTPNFNKIIYDSDIPNTAIPVAASATSAGTSSVPNYTLVWDNWNQAHKGGDQNKVYVALEFKNNTGKDFWGQKNLVPADGVFYIVGVLDPDVTSDEKLTELGKTAEQYKADKSLGVTWPAKYALPPYDSSNSNDFKTIKERRVFMQDYMTEANFTITDKSLKHAYVTVPDLRSTQISLGLSVDLKWQTGLVFDDIPLGGE